MLKCNYCNRNFKEEYKNCPGCGSNSFKKIEDKLDYVIETPPKGGYKLINMDEFKINESDKNALMNVLIFIILFILIFIDIIFLLIFNKYLFQLPFLITFLVINGIFFLFIILLLVGKKKINLDNRMTKREILQQKGVLYKNLPYTVETYTWKDSDGNKHTSYRIVIVHKMKDGQERIFKSKGKSSQKSYLSNNGTADLIVDPTNYDNYFVDIEIY